MLVASRRYGAELEHLEVPEHRLLELYPGLSSFEEHHRYAWIADPDSPVEWLQSLDDPDVVFAMLDPFLFCPEYAFELGDSDAAALGLETAQEATVRALLTLAGDAEDITANLFAPVILNARAGLGRQVLLQDSGWSLRYEVFRGLRGVDSDGGGTAAPRAPRSQRDAA